MTGQPEPRAQEISQSVLNQTADAMLSNDFAAFSAWFQLPHTIETPDAKTVLETRAELKTVFDHVVADYKRRGVTDLVRITEVAEYRGPHRIEAAHTTHMMAGAHRVAEPYPGYSVLEFTDGEWRISSSQYAVDQQTTVGRALAEAGFTPRRKENDND